jgi:hypothetical protein
MFREETSQRLGMRRPAGNLTDILAKLVDGYRETKLDKLLPWIWAESTRSAAWLGVRRKAR